MARTAILLTSILSLLAVFSLLKATERSSPTPSVSLINPFTADSDCSNKLAAECAVDIERTVKACAAAFESEGANVIADIKCTKDLLADKKNCWPCICYEAKQKGWKIIGC